MRYHFRPRSSTIAISFFLALEWAPYNIHVNAIGPSLIITQGTIHIKNDPKLAEKLGTNGRRRVEEKFSWTSIAEKTIKLYQEVIDEHKK